MFLFFEGETFNMSNLNSNSNSKLEGHQCTHVPQVGTEAEFVVTSVNIVGKSSEWSESSPVYRVVGRCGTFN